MVIKIDLEKAYDRLNWGFLMKVLEEIELPENFISFVKKCICTVGRCA